MRVTILGMGNGGLALAAALSLRGHLICGFSRNRTTLAEIQERRGVHLTGVLGDLHAPLARVTDDIEDAVADCELAVITVPGTFQQEYLRLALPHLDASQALWLAPGNGASLLGHQMLHELGRAPLLFIETATLPYVGRRTGPAQVHSRAKVRTHMATFPATRFDEGYRLVEECCDVLPASNVLETTLLNVNCVIHPLPSVLNWGWIESRRGAFSLYGEGMTAGVLASLEKLDEERYRVALALEFNGLRLDEIYAAQQIPPLYRLGMKIGAAERYEDRFILEDVPVGLVTVSDLGAQVGVETPVCDSTITLASAIYRQDLRAAGRTTKALGISDMNVGELTRFLRDGPASHPVEPNDAALRERPPAEA